MAKITNQSKLISSYVLPDTTKKTTTIFSNISETENMTTSFLKERTSDKSFIMAGGEVTQNLKLTNNSMYPVSDTHIQDELSAGCTFKAGSLKINGVLQPDLDPVVGFDLTDDIVSGGECTISYDIEVADAGFPANITTKSTITYSVNELTDFKENSNSVVIEVEKQLLTIVKSVDKEQVKAGDTVTYKHIVTNSGTMKNTDVFFSDALPSGVTFVEGSVMIDGVSDGQLDPNAGFELNDLDVNETTTVTFEATVD